MPPVQCGHINNQPVGLILFYQYYSRKWLLYDIQPPGRIHVHGAISWRAGSDINSKVNDTGRSIAFSVLPGSTILNMDAGIRICGNGGPVPVTLLSFTASPQKNAVFLFWQTAAEYQNDHFAIERSINGRDFIQIGRMAGHGTTSCPTL